MVASCSTSRLTGALWLYPSLKAIRVSRRAPRALFTLSTTTRYEPSPDGQRFLVTAVMSDASPISIILNWKPPGD